MPLDGIPQSDAEYYGDVHNYLDVTVKTRKETEALLARGWRVVLPILFPHIFSGEISAAQAQYWDLFWEVTFLLRDKKKVPKKKLKRLLIWGRGLAKSTTIEVAALMKGAILNGGYCLYVCETQDQANEHISNIRDLIENPESRFAQYFPQMAAPKQKKFGKSDEKWTEELFVCANGWVCRAKGLTAKMRGIRYHNQRPDDIKIDDIDDVNDSITLSMRKLRLMTASIFGTQATLTTIDFAQNLIGENSVLSQIYTGKADALGERTSIGIVKTFVKLDLEQWQDSDGRVRWRILPTSIPTWAVIDIEVAQGYLDDVGRDVFLAEYQNEFDHLKQGKVVYEYNEPRHVITWSMFKKVFGSTYIPPHWKAAAGTDIGYTNESITAWTFAATAAKNTKYPGLKFVYRGLTFAPPNNGIDYQAIKLWRHLLPNPSIGKRHFEAATDFGKYPELLRILRTNEYQKPFLKGYQYNPKTDNYDLDRTDAVELAASLMDSQIEYWLMSHEKSGEQKTLSQKYGLPVRKTKHFGKEDGITEWNHLLHGDYLKPHPFLEDRKLTEEECEKLLLPNGSYMFGCPYLFYIVADEQLTGATDDAGLKTHRETNLSWERTKEKLTDLGLTESRPMKYKSDTADSERMIYAHWGATATEMTTDEKVAKTIEENHPTLTAEAISQIENSQIKQQRLLRRGMKEDQIKRQIEEEDYLEDDFTAWLRATGQI